MAISKTKNQGGELVSIPSAGKAAFLFSSHPKRERDQETLYIIMLATTTGKDNYHTA